MKLHKRNCLSLLMITLMIIFSLISTPSPLAQEKPPEEHPEKPPKIQEGPKGLG